MNFAENSNHIVTRNVSHFRIILNDAVFPSSTTDESDNDFQYNIYGSNHNNRPYPLHNPKLPY